MHIPWQVGRWRAHLAQMHLLRMQANFIQYHGYTIVYRRYASLFFIVGIDKHQVHLRGSMVLALPGTKWPMRVVPFSRQWH
jgi:Clathrin adaptor complex small chain